MRDIKNILSSHEGTAIEAKSAKGGFPDSFWETFSAFANTDGGVILLGVNERKDHGFVVEGLADAVKSEKDFWNMVNNRQKVNRNIMTNHMVHIEHVDGKDILVVEQDVEAMLQFYDDPNEYAVEDFVVPGEDKVQEGQYVPQYVPQRDCSTTEKNDSTTEKNDITTEKNDSTTEKILDFIKKKPNINATEMAKELGLSVDGIDFNIRKLKQQNKIRRVGGRKSGRWEII